MDCIKRECRDTEQMCRFLILIKNVTVCSAGMAPAFIVPPVDITVTDGAVATFTCQVSGAPKAAIIWKRGNASAM